MRLQLREIGGRGRARVALIPSFLGVGARPLGMRGIRRTDAEQEADQRGGATRECLRPQHQGGKQQRNPRARSPPLRAALRRGRALVGRHEIAHGAGLVG